jgi:murein DD-endopeptidase MepM/ murein hydrolase activator NlpD
VAVDGSGAGEAPAPPRPTPHPGPRPAERPSPRSSAPSPRRRRPGRQSVIAGLTAVALAVVGSIAGVAVKEHKSPPSVTSFPLGKSSPAPGTDTQSGSHDPLTTATGAPVASRPTARVGPVVPIVAPLRNRVDPDLFLSAPTTVTAAQIAAVTRATGATRLLQVDFAQVKLGGGITTAVGVDPSTFRQYTPDNTAPVDALWQRVAGGDAAIAHAVAAALAIRLGGHTKVGRVVQRDVRVGAFATTRLPGVGVVVDRNESTALGLIRGAALIMALPTGADPLVALSAAQQVMPKAKVEALRYSSQNGLTSGSGPSGPTVPGGVPIYGNGWTLPLPLGSFTISQLFHDPGTGGTHPGVDMASPYGTPIYAAAEGDVLYWGPAQGFGNWIVLQHPGGIQTVYGHMAFNELLVGPTAHVAAGQLIARVGTEGESTGPHLHFEVHVDNSRVDPVVWLRAHGVTEIQDFDGFH